VNVVANLIAAAVIYLAGVIAGLFPRSPALIGSAIVTLLMALFGAFALASRFLTGHGRALASLIALLAGGLGAVLAGILNATNDSIINRTVLVLFGVLTSYSATRRYKRQKRRLKSNSSQAPQ
jgi:hypothetical protein